MTKLNLMPAELVAKLAEDEEFGFSHFDISWNHQPPDKSTIDTVRHAWIEAAQALEEKAAPLACDRNIRAYSGDWHAAWHLRAAARDLRQAAREDVEP